MRQVEWLNTKYGSLALRQDGTFDGVPLLLLQRFRGTMDDWDPNFVTALSQNRRIIRFDSAGIGRSNGTVPDTVTGIADVAAEVVRELGLPQVDVLGWSLGGIIAQQLALDYPDLVRRLIVAGSSPGVVEGAPEPHPRVSQVMTKPENDEDDFLFLFYPDTETAKSAGRDSLARIRNQPDRGLNVSTAGFMTQIKAIISWPGSLSRANEFRQPMLVANGAHDVMLPAYRSYALSQKVSNAKLVIYPDAGHGFLFQKIEEFTREVDAFLTK